MIITSLYQARKKVYSDPPSGGFEKLRVFCFYLVLITYFLIPWIEVNSRKILLFDLSNNKFYVLGSIFWPQDFILLALSLIIIVILLFGVTVYAGRVWCGYLCPQTIWIRLYNLIARFIEGSRNKRIKLDKKEISAKVVFLKTFKHFLWILVAFFTSITFLGYFIPIEMLIDMFLNMEFKTWSFFWLMFFIFTTYFDAGWLCEQFCFLICPYARLQTVMFDKNTLIVAYDFKRGEKRGHRSRNNTSNISLGDCVDCRRCVNVCPTGIDIRDGLQIECISCAACIDACNSIMKKMNYKPNLIRYTGKSLFKTSFRENTRFFTYVLAIFLLLSTFFYLLYNRELIYFNVIRDQTIFNLVGDDLIENSYILKITNKDVVTKNYIISIKNNNNFHYSGIRNITLSSGESTSFFAKLYINKKYLSNQFSTVTIKIECIDNNNKNDCVERNIKFISVP